MEKDIRAKDSDPAVDLEKAKEIGKSEKKVVEKPNWSSLFKWPVSAEDDDDKKKKKACYHLRKPYKWTIEAVSITFQSPNLSFTWMLY